MGASSSSENGVAGVVQQKVLRNFDFCQGCVREREIQ